ncbi:hypothetical protein BT63DRAFT_408802 [Microthyrium microscopicum]|uniref:Uncharacterized protein n=1 Tax=Microthyrium microscopicum TaxID=703497 RepID=A0A6A6UQS8_9PEZI|nr:hypothetical protein BT63DRAFT_408802 [Microthyrium microscopicum]
MSRRSSATLVDAIRVEVNIAIGTPNPDEKNNTEVFDVFLYIEQAALELFLDPSGDSIDETGKCETYRRIAESEHRVEEYETTLKELQVEKRGPIDKFNFYSFPSLIRIGDEMQEAADYLEPALDRCRNLIGEEEEALDPDRARVESQEGKIRDFVTQVVYKHDRYILASKRGASCVVCGSKATAIYHKTIMHYIGPGANLLGQPKVIGIAMPVCSLRRTVDCKKKAERRVIKYILNTRMDRLFIPDSGSNQRLQT